LLKSSVLSAQWQEICKESSYFQFSLCLLFANLEKIKKIKALLAGELEFEMLDVLNQMNQAKSAITDLQARSSCSLWRSRYQLLNGQVLRDQ